jgi:hypothetical protein
MLLCMSQHGSCIGVAPSVAPWAPADRVVHGAARVRAAATGAASSGGPLLGQWHDHDWRPGPFVSFSLPLSAAVPCLEM